MTIKHSFLPPSGAHAWSKCALWPTMNARYPEAGSAESEEGTAAHWVAFAGQPVKEDQLAPNGVVVTGEMIEGAELLAQVIRERTSGLRPVVETAVRINAIADECFGTPDFWAYDEPKGHLEIIDYKFGHRFVDEYWNPQGLLYMLGIVSTLDSLPDTVSFTIVQPRCFYRGEPVRTHTYRIEEATPHLSKLREAAARASVPTPTATTGPHCEHCPGRHACSTLQKAAYSASETSTDQQPLELTPQAAALELKMLRDAKTRLDARVSGLEAQTEANLKAGLSVPHYKLEPTRGRRTWKIPEAQVIKKLGKKRATVTKVITPTQARKLYLDESHYIADTEHIPGGLRLVESNNQDAARVFKKET